MAKKGVLSRKIHIRTGHRCSHKADGGADVNFSYILILRERKRIQGHNPNVTSLIYMREHLHLLYIPPRGSEKIDSGAAIINGAFT